MSTTAADSEEAKPHINCQRMVLIGIGLVVLLTIVILGVAFTLPRTDVSSAVDSEASGYDDAIFGTSLSDTVQLYSKEQWGGLPPKDTRVLDHPTPFVVISDTMTPSCDSFLSCSQMMRNIQKFHFLHSLSDVGHNFLVGGDGNVYEGRGWDATNMHTGFVRWCNVAVSFIGTFIDERPPEQQVNAVLELLNLGVRLGKISADHKLLAMNQTASVASPGPQLYSIIKQWPHYWLPTEHDEGKCPYAV